MITKIVFKNNLPFLPFLLSNDKKMSEKIYTIFRENNLKMTPL